MKKFHEIFFRRLFTIKVCMEVYNVGNISNEGNTHPKLSKSSKVTSKNEKKEVSIPSPHPLAIPSQATLAKLWQAFFFFL